MVVVVVVVVVVVAAAVAVCGAQSRINPNDNALIRSLFVHSFIHSSKR
jgi:hypothetical protein